MLAQVGLRVRCAPRIDAPVDRDDVRVAEVGRPRRPLGSSWSASGSLEEVVTGRRPVNSAVASAHDEPGDRRARAIGLLAADTLGTRTSSGGRARAVMAAVEHVLPTMPCTRRPPDRGDVVHSLRVRPHGELNRVGGATDVDRPVQSRAAAVITRREGKKVGDLPRKARQPAPARRQKRSAQIDYQARRVVTARGATTTPRARSGRRGARASSRRTSPRAQNTC